MKRMLMLLVTCALASATFAGSISRGGGSFSSGKSYSSAPARSVGVQKSLPATPSKPPVSPAPVSKPYSPPPQQAPTPAPVPNYSPAPAVGGGPGLGGTFLAGLGGGFLGSLIGNSIGHGPTVVASGGSAISPMGAAPLAGGVAPVTVVSSSGWAWFWFFLLLCVLVLVGIIVYQRRRDNTVISGLINGTLRMENIPEFLPYSLFKEIQTAFALADKWRLKPWLGDSMQQMLEDLPNPAGTYTLQSVTVKMLIDLPTEKSVHYTAYDKADGSRLNEVWNYELIDGGWKLVGIQQR